MTSLDWSAHYDLAVAYREMGLLSDAIGEFEQAAGDPRLECTCRSMMGVLYRELGENGAAIDAFLKALKACTTAVAEQRLLYELGDTYAASGRREQARYFFRRLAKLQPGYDEARGQVEDRLRALGDDVPPDSAV